MIQFRFDMPLWLMGFYGGVMILVVLGVRALLGRWLPKRVVPVLWALVLVRLMLPFSISSPLTLPMPGFLKDAGDWAWTWGETSVNTSLGTAVQRAVQGVVITEDIPEKVPVWVDTATSYNSVEAASGLGGSIWDSLRWGPGNGMGWVWTAGAAALALGMAWRYAKGRRQFQGVYEIEENPLVWETLERCGVFARVYTCDTAQSPVTVGVLRPIILLPASMDFGEKETVRHILVHEAMHIRRRDNLLKLVVMAALCLHWYNPLVWLMARELCRDLEAACDEAAMSVLGQEESRPYAQSLLHMALPGLSGGLFVSAFCRTEVERRVKGVLAYKKLGLLSVAASAVLVLTAATAFATCGQTFFDSYLGDWCSVDGRNFLVRAELNRPIDLGESQDYARSRANAVVMDALKNTPQEITQETLGAEIAKRLGTAFGVEPSAFGVEVSSFLSSQRLEEEYKAHGLLKTADGGWTYNGKRVHVLEDRMGGTYFSDSRGEIDVYVMRSEQFAITGVESFLYYRF